MCVNLYFLSRNAFLILRRTSSVLALPLGTRSQYRVKHDSNAGGGGERVLWAAVALLQRTSPDIISVVYSGDGDAGKDKIIEKVKVSIYLHIF